jgi:hypothetical protein
MDDRTRRIGENEVVFREVNERIGGLASRLGIDTERFRIVCECGNAECVEQIDLPLDEYRAVRDDPAAFAVVPGHEIPQTEYVVRSTRDYNVVRKREGEPAELAASHAPKA